MRPPTDGAIECVHGDELVRQFVDCYPDPDRMVHLGVVEGVAQDALPCPAGPELIGGRSSVRAASCSFVPNGWGRAAVPRVKRVVVSSPRQVAGYGSPTPKSTHGTWSWSHSVPGAGTAPEIR